MINRARSACLALSLATMLALSACTASPAPPTSPPPAPTSWQAEMLANLNVHRANAGLGPLAMCGTLNVAAERQSQAQASANRMFHADLAANANGSGYGRWTALAENVAYGQRSVAQVMAAWMSSPGHKANILGGYQHVGFGLANAANGTPYWTQSFGSSGTC